MSNYKWLNLHYTLDELVTQDSLLRVFDSKICICDSSNLFFLITGEEKR